MHLTQVFKILLEPHMARFINSKLDRRWIYIEISAGMISV